MRANAGFCFAPTAATKPTKHSSTCLLPDLLASNRDAFS